MIKTTFTTAAVLLGFAAMAPAEDATKTETASAAAAACCTSDKSCKSPCCKGEKESKCGEEAWLDIETITVEAANGDPIAQYTVAYLTEIGNDSTPADPEKAKDWYSKSLPGLEKAAAEGHPAACRALAHMYAEGKGVEKNPEMAEKYTRMYRELCAKKADEHNKDTKPCPPAPQDNPQPAQN